jgi:hypothetical protein
MAASFEGENFVSGEKEYSQLDGACGKNMQQLAYFYRAGQSQVGSRFGFEMTTPPGRILFDCMTSTVRDLRQA